MKKLIILLFILLIPLVCYATIDSSPTGRTICSGQKLLTSTAAQIGTACSTTHEILIESEDWSKGVAYIGDSTVTIATGYKLQTGETVTIKVDDDGDVYALGTGDDHPVGIYYIGIED
jgi:hypothetical protein